MELLNNKGCGGCKGDTRKRPGKLKSGLGQLEGGQSDHKSHAGNVGEQRSEAAEEKLGGTVCISKSKEWNDLAPSPTRSA